GPDPQRHHDAAGEGEGRGVGGPPVPDAASCRQEAIDYATRIAAGPSVALGHAKLAITQGYGAPLDLGLALEREAISRVFVSQDANEGIKAFGEKRKADFKGE